MSKRLAMPEHLKAGQCKICTINLYKATETDEPRPLIFPCGIKDCPYETEEEYWKHREALDKEFEKISSYGESET